MIEKSADGAILKCKWQRSKEEKYKELTSSMPRTSILVSGNLATFAIDEYTRLSPYCNIVGSNSAGVESKLCVPYVAWEMDLMNT